ncbi:MAG: hypothetical protein ABIJ97_04945 [Bacteroidota bacterium]
MRKSIISFVMILMASISIVNAQFTKGNILISAGISFGDYWYFGNTVWVANTYNYLFIPPVVAKLEIGVHEYLGIGAFGGIQYRKYKNKINSSYYHNYSYISGGVMGSFHFTQLLSENLDLGNLEELDMYISTTVRLEFTQYQSSYYYDTATNTYITHTDNYIKPRFGAGLGLRYYFAKNLAIFAELGSCNLGYFTLGGTLKL